MTETALLQFAKDLGWENWKETCELSKIIQTIPFSSERKAMGVVVRLPSGRYRLFLKGTSEIREHGEHERPASSPSFPPPSPPPPWRLVHGEVVTHPHDVRSRAEPSPSWLVSCDMTLVAITGIEDPLCPGVRKAITTCHRAGVTIKMCTGDSGALTARSIATQCGIYTAGGIIMEGPFFRALDPHERLEVVPRLQVLARSSPKDKKILVETLHSLGKIIGVTGDGTDDGPALKTANVGFSTSIAGTKARRSSRPKAHSTLSATEARASHLWSTACALCADNSCHMRR